MRKPILIGATALAMIIAFAPRSFAGGDESTWGVPAYTKKAVEARRLIPDRLPMVVAPPAEPIKPVVQTLVTVPIEVDAHGQPICDYGHAMFAGRNDLFQRYCTVAAESTAEPSSRNNNSPQ